MKRSKNSRCGSKRTAGTRATAGWSPWAAAACIITKAKAPQPGAA